MRSDASTVEEYMAELPEERKEPMQSLRRTILKNLPEGFSEQMAGGMIQYMVPLTRYPPGYHAQKGEPLPFMALASQKRHIALYHMGLYQKQDLKEWFTAEYEKRVPSRLDMDKSCIRFRKPETIPYDLLAELIQKMSVDEYIELYENTRKGKK